MIVTVRLVHGEASRALARAGYTDIKLGMYGLKPLKLLPHQFNGERQVLAYEKPCYPFGMRRPPYPTGVYPSEMLLVAKAPDGRLRRGLCLLQRHQIEINWELERFRDQAGRDEHKQGTPGINLRGPLKRAGVPACLTFQHYLKRRPTPEELKKIIGAPYPGSERVKSAPEPTIRKLIQSERFRGTELSKAILAKTTSEGTSLRKS